MGGALVCPGICLDLVALRHNGVRTYFFETKSCLLFEKDAVKNPTRKSGAGYLPLTLLDLAFVLSIGCSHESYDLRDKPVVAFPAAKRA